MPFIDIAPPLSESPGFSIWQEYAGEEYVVYVDESFYQFFGFQRGDGNFCHGVFGVPKSQRSGFEGALATAISDYSDALRRLGIHSQELKHADLYKLPFQNRTAFAIALDEALKAHAGFVIGFYTSNRGFVLEKIREDLIAKDQAEVPEEYGELYRLKVAELNGELDTVGRAHLIGRLLNTAIAATSNFLGAFDCPFRLIYDPREPKEDSHLGTWAEGYFATLRTIGEKGLPGPLPGCLSFDASHSSSSDLGIQIADIVAGEVRRFFRFNPELLRFGSDLRLVTPDSGDPLESFILNGNRALKDGRLTRTPERLVRQYMKPTSDVFFPMFIEMTAAGCLCCVTDFGQERIVRLFQGWLFDLCD